MIPFHLYYSISSYLVSINPPLALPSFHLWHVAKGPKHVGLWNILDPEAKVQVLVTSDIRILFRKIKYKLIIK